MNTPTLLIVDDEKTTREGLRDALQDRFDVYLAADAKTATELLEEEHFDVLLTDFRLPTEDGMKLIARAKSLPKPPVCNLRSRTTPIWRRRTSPARRPSTSTSRRAA